MAKGKFCPYCGNPMEVHKEKPYPAGTEVIYICKSEKCQEFKIKIFEDKIKN